MLSHSHILNPIDAGLLIIVGSGAISALLIARICPSVSPLSVPYPETAARELQTCMTRDPEPSAKEFGSFHFQATQLDAIGLALLNSPEGLAADIKGHLSTGTSEENLDPVNHDWGHQINDVLPNVMIFSVSRSASTGTRFCKENVLAGSGVILAALFARVDFVSGPLSLPDTVYWGPIRVPRGSTPPKDDETIHEFTVEYGADLIAGLREQIKNTRWVEPVENSAYHYGVNLGSFRDVMEYWRTEFDFNKSLAEINAYPHYRTEIEGLKIHFFRSTVEPRSADVEVVPLMLIHGWPGSFAEFLKVVPLLKEVKDGIAFDIVVPSLPGYGFSEAPTKSGVDVAVAARILKKLMARLGYSRYFVQGGDWGSFVTAAMGTLYPEDVRGIHLNLLLSVPSSLMSITKFLLLKAFPGHFSDGPMPPCMSVDVKSQLHESGYFYIQATKPDTLGLAHLNSPVGLAAHMMEKFSAGIDERNRDLIDGGLGRKIPVDHMLANVMVYHASRSAVSSLRFYKENFLSRNMLSLFKVPIKVPTGYTIFPDEISCFPRFIATDLLPNLTTLTYQSSGGHFVAMEEPKALAEDVRKYVRKVIDLYPERR
ncbi:epoxide hydrolase 1 [Galendromus occidentalis]|uniref:Epoxide hydrolase 1 n=1 Tax=Galendromus occidentalis TaxID=34638 RepID=A0AAJ6QXU7_9ACAR|nr:epoxide hydrolase 1 [Galendromus occidentalis]